MSIFVGKIWMWIHSFLLGIAGAYIYKVWTAVDRRGEIAAAERSYQDGLKLRPKQRGGT